MNRHPSFLSRVALGLVAAAMTTMTLGVFVIAPATMPAAGDDARNQAAGTLLPSAPTEVVIAPSRIEVIGVRETELASTRAGDARSSRRQGG